MTAYIVKRGTETVGFITDRKLAEHLDGKEIVVDGMYQRKTYTIDEVENEDVMY